jgi:surfeit locus 1 family protein
VLALIGTTLLLGLTAWQLQRREWKHQLIERVERRVHAAPVAAPGPQSASNLTAAQDEYRHVTVQGRFLHERETLVKAVTTQGPGYWVLTPLMTDAGYTVLVNRGFVPEDRREAATRVPGQIEGEVRVTGLLRLTEPGGAFLRSNQAAQERWYSRDVEAISRARQLTEVVPYFIDLDVSAVPGGLPVAGLTVIAFPDNHLVYALTWLTLALLLAGSTVRVATEEWTQPAGGRKTRCVGIAAASP